MSRKLEAEKQTSLLLEKIKGAKKGTIVIFEIINSSTNNLSIYYEGKRTSIKRTGGVDNSDNTYRDIVVDLANLVNHANNKWTENIAQKMGFKVMELSACKQDAYRCIAVLVK